MSLRALIAVMAAIVMVASACSGDDARAHPYSTQSAAIGESLSILGWNISVSNQRFDADYVLVDVDASPSQKDGPHAKPEDIRFGLYGALAHPIEANALGGCKDVTSLALQPLSATTPDRLTGTVCLGPQRDAVQVRASLCTQGEINAALLYATVSMVGTHAGLSGQPVTEPRADRMGRNSRRGAVAGSAARRPAVRPRAAP